MKHLITIIVSSISFLVLFACVSKKKLILPEPETISVISLQEKLSEYVKTINKREEILKLIEDIQKHSTSTTFESLNDQPTNDSVVYLYTRKEKQYIEHPYVGIWQVSPDIANRIEEAFFINLYEIEFVSSFKR